MVALQGAELVVQGAAELLQPPSLVPCPYSDYVQLLLGAAAYAKSTATQLRPVLGITDSALLTGVTDNPIALYFTNSSSRRLIY